MENLLDAIRAAVAADATEETKASGATACRTILLALEAKVGEPLAAPIAPAASPIAAIAAGLRSMPIDQLLDLAIMKLRTVAPATAAQTPERKPLNIPLVKVPR